MFEHKKILILGMARSGYEAAKVLSQHFNHIIITDAKEQDEDHVRELDALGVKVIITKDPLYLMDNSIDMVIKNPGITYEHPLILKALELGILVTNEVEVAYHFLPKDITIIGITGSNGKTTTTSLIYKVLSSVNSNVHLGGNIGLPVCALVGQVKSGDIVVLEISGHQLHDTFDFKTNISVMTNLYPVHLDFFKTYEYYKEMKSRIFNHHTKDDLEIINLSNNDSKEYIDKLPNVETFSLDLKSDAYIKDNHIYYKDERIINIKDILIKGNHNYENIMCAIIVAKHLGLSNEAIKKAISDFRGVEHRIEFVLKINNREFYNDSKSTNTESTIVALKSFNGSTILLLGGLDRGHSFEPLTPYLNKVSSIICYGETKNRILEYAKSINKDCHVTDNLKEAVNAAYNISSAGDTILLSPACASWDQYEDFEKRGLDFKKEVEKLGEKNE